MGASENQREPSEVVAEAVQRQLSLGTRLERFATGSLPVFALDDEHVIKLFPPGAGSHFETEHTALSGIGGRLSISTPRVVATGKREGWSYVVMTRLSGSLLCDTWPSLHHDDRSRLVRDVGTALAELHALPTMDLAPLSVDWPRFVEEQRDSCRERQLAKGLGAPWLEQLDTFLTRWTPVDSGQRVLLHTEVMREHLLVEQREGLWQLSGLFDFEPAMLGPPEYELSAVGIFVTAAEPTLLGTLLDAYGATMDDALPLRIMTYSLLHRYSNLRWYIERLGVPPGVSDLETLAHRWFSP
jgi:hygromycin-B 7''-O-kinase